MTSITTVLLIALAGGVGAALRFVADSWVPLCVRERFPWGIFAINLVGSFALGVVIGMSLDEPWLSTASIGLLGGFTTFSTASLDTVELVRKRRYAAAALNGPGMLLASVLLALAGVWVAR